MKKLLLFLVIGLFLACRAFMSPQKQDKYRSQSPKQLLFQIGDKTGRLLIRGEGFTGSAATFWKIWERPCIRYCDSKDSIYIEDIRSPDLKKVMYGNALFVRKQNFWYLTEFVASKR